MRIFSAFLLLFFSLSAALAFQIPTIIKDALFGRFLNPPHQDVVPTNFDFWHSLKDLGDKANTYKEKILQDAEKEYASAIKELNEFKNTMSRVVNRAETISTILKEVPDSEEFQKQFGVRLARALDELKEEFSEPLPENRTERYLHQASIITRALDKCEDALVDVFGFWEIPEASVRTKFNDIKPEMNHVLLIVCNLANNHPDLLETLPLSAAIMVIPLAGIPMLQLVLRFFGFGPLGPIKGSIAASAQRFFFGGVVKEGSWFSMLQSVGMEGLATKIIRAIKCFF